MVNITSFKELISIHMMALSLGIVLDIIFGDPHRLFHPVRAVGAVISLMERKLNRPDGTVLRKSLIRRGTLMWVSVLFITASATALVLTAAYMAGVWVYLAAETILTYYILAAGSLRDESMKVCNSLPRGSSSSSGEICDEREAEVSGSLTEAKKWLAFIVGRDTEPLDERGVITAAVETVAENTSDGVIAPLLYTALGGPVLGMMYKAANTMDSMVGYHNERFEHFGRTAAVADDVWNFLPSRISAVFMIAASFAAGMICRLFNASGTRNGADHGFVYDGGGSWRIWRRDRLKHKSPNSAQTESACAGSLGIRLGGSSYYGGELVKKPYIGNDSRAPETEDIKRSVTLMFATEAVCTAVIFTIMMLILIFP